MLENYITLKSTYMNFNFTAEELEFLLQSASYSKKRFEEYDYENEDIRKKNILEAENVIKKIRFIIKGDQ